MADIGQVNFALYSGGGNIASWIKDACAAAGVPLTDYWSDGLTELCKRESSDRPNAVNTTDPNATGPIVLDGHPRNCSRGVAQCVPETFAQYHAEGTSWQIYDPVANIAAAIKYIMARYGVQEDGSDLASKVQQADPDRPPRGYTIEI
jgi:SLT domain-containing protein